MPDPLLDIEKIMQILPHRYPFLLVDRIVELERATRVVGYKNVTINEPFFQGHFPGRPIMPGVLIVEAMAQVGGVMAYDARPDEADAIIYFLSLDKVKFRRPVVPGDQLVMELTSVHNSSRAWKMAGRATVDGNLCCQAELTAALGSVP